MSDETTRLFIGTDEVGRKLRKTYDAIARKHYAGSLSAMFREAANEKWGIDPATGEMKSGKFPTGSPKSKIAKTHDSQNAA